MIGIIAAMDVEMKSLRSFMTDTKTETVSGITFVSGTLEGKLVVTAVCGIGKVFAAMCAQTMILRYQPECIVNTGVAGALSDKLSIGSVAISSAVVQHDMDTSALGDPLGLISGVNKVQLPADSDLCGQLSACATVLGIRTETGVIASGDQFISSAERKDAIVKTFGAIACEMEGAAIGQVCYVNRVPFCVLRAISDSADGSSHMDYPTFVGMAAEQSVKLLRTFLKKLIFRAPAHPLRRFATEVFFSPVFFSALFPRFPLDILRARRYNKVHIQFRFF
ncbi:MAG: 5'-methylthioadenosine/adenosylhomocysteine nucleosidase [Christensenellales bacterium]